MPIFHPARPDCDDEFLSLTYMGGTPLNCLNITQMSERDNRMDERIEWEIVNVDGRSLEVSDPSPDDGFRVVLFEQDGTNILIMSEMPMEQLLKVAVSFESVDG